MDQVDFYHLDLAGGRAYYGGGQMLGLILSQTWFAGSPESFIFDNGLIWSIYNCLLGALLLSKGYLPFMVYSSSNIFYVYLPLEVMIGTGGT